ncbi:MAG: helix-turn-helix transcriptional regulator [Firmicutes bacterium]|nr:helix-turn-helix transcriptional regulator [Bacillota bacterium]
MDQQKIGSFIAELRHEKGLTQEQLAQKLAVSNKTVSRWETGKYMPDISMLQELCRFFDISLNELLSGERITNEKHFALKAEENILHALASDSSFGLNDKITYFKSKWLKEHRLLITSLIISAFIALLVLIYMEKTILIPGLAVLFLVVYAYIRNKMMIYVEHRAFKEEN